MDWGVPPWQNGFVYDFAYSEGMTADEWRWEFLRRRIDYRESFFAAVASLSNLPGKPAWISEADSERFSGDVIWPFEHEEAGQFQLHEFFDPRQAEWLGLGPRWTWSTPWVLGLNTAGDEPDMEFVGFDLRAPLGPQVKEVESWLLGMQEAIFLYEDASRLGIEHAGPEAEKIMRDALREPKSHRKKWPTYLRVLDARAAGASLAEIAGILPDHMGRRDPQTAHNVLKQAEQQQFRF